MHLKYLKTILDAQNQLSRIGGLAWSANHQKLAVATADRSIILFDENGERRDKFSTKPSGSADGKTSYVIRGLVFSPDSTSLAVAQSDNIVYVYKLGTTWKEKKVICNKFPQPTAVNVMVWLSVGPIIIGLEDGKVRALNCKTNRSQNLYAAEYTVVSLAANVRGTGFVSGHEDGSVIRFFIVDESKYPSGRLFQHTSSPLALAWAQNDIVAAGCDRKIIFYNVQKMFSVHRGGLKFGGFVALVFEDGNVLMKTKLAILLADTKLHCLNMMLLETLLKGQQSRVFDYSHDDNEKEFTSAACSPNGQSIAIGSYDQIRIFTWSPRQKTWIDVAKKEIKNLYSVSALTWRSDGARLVVGSICGAVLLFESVLKRTVWHDKFELTYVTHSQLLVKSLHESDSTELIVESRLGLEIDDVRFMGRDNYLVGHTEDSLILCDLTRNLTSELSWSSTGHNEKFYFDNPNVCFIFNAGELTLVEYGVNVSLGSVRTEFVNPHVISVRINERGSTRDNKKLAYLMDMKTISVVDLVSQTVIGQINHESRIDWLELSETAHKILFRDKKMRLILFDIGTSRKYNLMDKVSFVQWVPQSDVVIAQSDSNLAIWYNIDVPQHVTIVPIRGEVMQVIRDESTTEVKMSEGPTEHSYRLDQGLVEFGTAVNDNDFGNAVIFLESHDDKSAAKAMWHNLARISLYQQNLRVAQRCFVALGNASMAFFLDKTIKQSPKEFQTQMHGNEVRARMALVNCDLKSAERIYLDQGNIEAAISVYKQLRLWDDAIKLAERRGYHGLDMLREQQMSFLLSTNQEELAGYALEESGDTDRAMTLYLKANKPVKAARLALKWPSLLQDNDLMNRVAKSLVQFELYELAGDLSNKMRRPEIAIEMYRRGGAYARAIELARNVSPDEVTNLEEEWGDWLVSKRQMDASISHYIEAGATVKALEAAVGAKQWRKAVQIAKVIDEPIEIRKYAVQMSHHLTLLGDKKGAEDILVRAELYKEAVDMLNTSGQWERAYVIAEKYLGSEIVRDMFVEMAGKLEQDGKYRDCERVFIAISEPDLAISMYERLEQYDAMIRLVERYHKDLLDNTHLHIAKQLEAKSKYKMAEGHYLAAGDWKAVVHMYCSIGKWEEAHRIAVQKGTEDAANQVAYIWSRSLPLEGAARLLTKMNLIKTALLYACDAKQFEFALDLCRVTGHSNDEVHLRIAMDLEDEGKFVEAETEFLLAGKPKEAILMYSHSRDWRSALRVAEKYLPDSVNEILISQATESLESHNYQEYEALLIRAERPDIVLQHYKESEMWPEAIRIAREYVPTALQDILRLQARNNRSSAMINNDSRALLHHASEYTRNEEFKKAAQCLLKINSTNADQTTVEQALVRAAEICNQFLEGDDAMEVAGELGPRLVEINQFGPAAQLYLAADMPKEAVDVFIQSENWGKARRLAKEINPQLLNYVETQQKSRLRMENNVEQLADIDIIGALDLLAEQGHWIRCIEKAKQHSSVVMHKYLALYATQLIKDNECVEALAAYMKYGAPPLPQNFNIYNRIVVECIGLRETDGVNIWKELRTFLFNLTQSIKLSDTVIDALDRFEQLLLIVHYYVTRAACREISSLKVLAVKISVALLRYTEVIPVDKGFYEAGMDLRSIGRESEAFVILNHYLDVSEAIDGADGLVDHLNLAATDFPNSVPIPSDLHLKNEIALHEEVREWVLSVSMDQRVDQVLPIDERNLFESSLGMSDQPCIITGYPVVGKQPIIFQRSQRQANRDAWSKISVAAKMEPHSGVPDVIEFVEKWCGVANFVN